MQTCDNVIRVKALAHWHSPTCAGCEGGAYGVTTIFAAIWMQHWGRLEAILWNVHCGCVTRYQFLSIITHPSAFTCVSEWHRFHVTSNVATSHTHTHTFHLSHPSVCVCRSAFSGFLSVCALAARAAYTTSVQGNIRWPDLIFQHTVLLCRMRWLALPYPDGQMSCNIQ